MAAPPPAPVAPVRRWTVLAASCAVMFSVGAIYSFSVLRNPLVQEKGLALNGVLLAYSVNAGIGPIPMILGGRLVDHGWARRLALIGGGMFGLGWIISGLSTNVVTLVVGYGLVAGLGQGLAYSACLANVMRLFPDRRGTAAGLSIGANGASSVVVAPLARYLVDGHGVERTMIGLGIAYALISAAAFTLIRVAPAGFWPAGVPRPVAAVRGASASSAAGVPPQRMLLTPAFWVIFLVFVCGAFSGLMIAANASPIGVAMYGMTAGSAALAVSGYAAGKMTGGIVLGAVSDRLGTARTLVLIFACITGFLALLVAVRGHAAGFMLGVFGLGTCFGGVMGVMPSLVSMRFGYRYQGVNYGIAFSAYAVSAYFAPHLAADLGEHSGDYTSAFCIAIGAACVGLVGTALLARLLHPAGTGPRPGALRPGGTGRLPLSEDADRTANGAVPTRGTR